MAYDIPSISELEAVQLLNKHYAEVITSKKDGIASGLDITQTTNPITGVVRRTLYKILDDMDVTFLERLLKMAFTPVGTFTAGATLTDARQTLLWEVSEGGDGRYYSWSGSFGTSGKVVSAGSSPSPIEAGSWVDRTDDSLRYEIRETVFQNMKRLAAEAGFNLVDGSFEEGANISGWPDVVWCQADGKYYQWYLDEAKTVAAGSTPATSGGIGAGSWVDRTDVVLREALSADNGASLVKFKPAGVTGAIKRALDEVIYDQIIDVKWFGAVGDWNMGTQTGSDDTVAIQSALTFYATLGSRRNGAKRAIKFPSGHYRYSALTIPVGLGFGLDIIGDGENSTYLWADHTNASPAFTCEIEFIKFSNMTLMGSLSDQNGGNSTLWKSVGFKGKLASNLADIDVKFENCGIYFWQGFAQIYGRGCVFDNCSIGSVLTTMNIVADPSTVFTPGSYFNSAQTGMRHYTFRNNRFDVVSRICKITGTGVHKDYINDILITGNDFAQCDILIDAADATIRRTNITGNNAVYSFATGVVQVKSSALGQMIGNNWSKEFDDTRVPDNGGDCINTLWKTTGGINGLTVLGNTVKNLSGDVVSAGAGSIDVEISDNYFPQAWTYAASTNHYVFNSPINCNGLIVDKNRFQTSTISGSYYLWNQVVQYSVNSVSGNNTAPWSWGDTRLIYTPKLLVNGTQSEAATTSAHGRFSIDDLFVYVDVMLIIDPTETTGNLSISLPSVTAIAENTGITGSYAGGGLVTKTTGFTSAGNVFAPIQVNPTTQEAELWKEGGMVKSRVTAADTSGTVLIAVSFKYRH